MFKKGEQYYKEFTFIWLQKAAMEEQTMKVQEYHPTNNMEAHGHGSLWQKAYKVSVYYITDGERYTGKALVYWQIFRKRYGLRRLQGLIDVTCNMGNTKKINISKKATSGEECHAG